MQGVSSDLIYLPKSVDEVNFVNAVDKSGKVLFTIDEQKKAYTEFINNNGLTKYQGTNFLTVVDNKTDKLTFNMNSLSGALVKDVTKNVSNVSTTWSAVLGFRYTF
ncbi:hypothetical protein [Sphingobacterium siyangense]|uniref:Outer membrane protein beta-barrel domain-containing protein n=1 Tax=Sphingobacterium multivorum TaxID=28454 RepID=A0ABX7CQD4_SPHMU|nr:hypothetical protein [Sphingobacterium multivorum]QQT29679.1 hypothetical protein I6I99_20370 [Sphingobacterium multivorum]QQT54302.1 hypothetical protein I6I98_03340 [Sphingobacterium multivorum]